MAAEIFYQYSPQELVETHHVSTAMADTIWDKLSWQNLTLNKHYRPFIKINCKTIMGKKTSV